MAQKLADLHAALAERFFPAAPFPSGSPELPYDQIAVALDPAEDATPRIVQIQHIPLGDGTEPIPPGHITHYLQFVSVVGVAVKPSVVGEVARLILALNKSLEWPGFGMSEKDLAIYLQIVHPCYGALPSVDAIEDVLAMMELCLDSFGPTLCRVAKGTMTLGQALHT